MDTLLFMNDYSSYVKGYEIISLEKSASRCPVGLYFEEIRIHLTGAGYSRTFLKFIDCAFKKIITYKGLRYLEFINYETGKLVVNQAAQKYLPKVSLIATSLCKTEENSEIQTWLEPIERQTRKLLLATYSILYMKEHAVK
ncbi:MAG: hypothetical protein ACI83D_000237 [Planctomycetota bacterium]|jgi:hypothetical protein